MTKEVTRCPLTQYFRRIATIRRTRVSANFPLRAEKEKKVTFAYDVVVVSGVAIIVGFVVISLAVDVIFLEVF